MDQEITRLFDIILHTHLRSITGNLYRLSFELLFLELGIGTDFAAFPIDYLATCATPSLATSTCKFFREHGLTLTHDIELRARREGDRMRMADFLAAGATLDDCLSLNRCRLFL
jgi:hypothetical protein